MIGTPGVLHTDKNMNTRMVDLATRLLADRIVVLQGEIDEDMATSICMQLRYLEAEDKDKPVTMYIQSPGGSISAGYSIIDTMNTLKCPVHTVAMGMTASMAVSVFLNGEKGERSMYEHSELLIHQPLSGMKGQASDMKIHTEHLLKLKTQLAQEYSKLTGISLKDMENMMDRDTILSSKECLKLKICDKIKK